MEKQFKPVPDVECLKYHGTPEKPDIKIFVSHRIDLDSETIDNPLYIPVRCGAIYDERENVEMLGDDTGDNISEKRMSFCELTVQYWAWKNIKADYYGLCYDDKYLGFSDTKCVPDLQGVVRELYLEPSTVSKHNLDNGSYMCDVIQQYDGIISSPFDVKKYYRPCENNYEYLKFSDFDIRIEDLNLFLNIIIKKYPKYELIIHNYLKNQKHRVYSCFVLKKELFLEFSEFEFQVLEEFDSKMSYVYSSEDRYKTPSFLGCLLLSIWIEEKSHDYNFAIKQIVQFDDCKKICEIKPFSSYNNVPVVLISSDFYAPYAATCLQSLIYNSSQNHNYDFIFMTRYMTKQNKETLLTMCANYSNISIRFYNPEPMLYKYKSKLSIDPRIDLLSFYRVALPYFMSNYNKAICIDCDLIFEKDIAILFDIDLGDNLLAAAKDPWVQGFIQGYNPKFIKYCKNEYPLKNINDYLNSGVAVYNLTGLRKTYSFTQVAELSTKQKYFIQEQDVINLLVEKRALILGEEWNLLAFTEDWCRHTLNYASKKEQDNYFKARVNPCVIHWAGAAKPWVNPNVDLAYRFWFYARQTPFYEIIVHRLMWDVRNYYPPQIQSPWESHARKISNKIIPKGTKRREFAKKILPKGSRRWNFFKKIYYFFFRKG